MWLHTFDDRLESWNQLRNCCQTLPPHQALLEINQWWFNAPWRPYYLHWDEQAAWPDPWQLLSDNIYCEVARGLGILYTINLLDRKDLAPVDLVLTKEGVNLVLAKKEKYILNWELDNIVNTNQAVNIYRRYQYQHII
jgi:hypothetical protein